MKSTPAAGVFLCFACLVGTVQAQERQRVPLRLQPPEEYVRGVITKVDSNNGLALVSLGSDSGLKKGHTLEVFRFKPAPEYVGVLRIVDAQRTTSIGRLIGQRAAKDGDHITSDLVKFKEAEAKNEELLRVRRDRRLAEEQRLTQVIVDDIRKATGQKNGVDLLRDALLRVWDHPDISEETRQKLLKRLLDARNKLNPDD